MKDLHSKWFDLAEVKLSIFIFLSWMAGRNYSTDHSWFSSRPCCNCVLLVCEPVNFSWKCCLRSCFLLLDSKIPVHRLSLYSSVVLQSVAKLVTHSAKFWNLLDERRTTAKRNTVCQISPLPPNQCWSLFPALWSFRVLSTLCRGEGGKFYLALGCSKIRQKRSSVSLILQPIVVCCVFFSMRRFQNGRVCLFCRSFFHNRAHGRYRKISPSKSTNQSARFYRK